jgi:hypothetical protein
MREFDTAGISSVRRKTRPFTSGGDEYGAGIRVVAEAGAQQASRFQAEEQSDMLSWRKIVAASFSRLSTLKAAFS